MDLFDIVAMLLVLIAGFAFLNERFFRLPIMLGLVLMALLCSALLLGILFFQHGKMVTMQAWLPVGRSYDVLVSTLLGLMLFAGALRLNLADMVSQFGLVIVLALLGVGLSVLLVGMLSWLFLAGLGVTVSPVYGLLFGALIAPIDPVIVRGLLTRAGVVPALRDQMVSESVLGAGIAVALAGVLLATLLTGGTVSTTHLLLWQVGGGLLFGLIPGLVVYRLLRLIDQYQVESLILLALVAGILVLTLYWQLSTPLALLMAGLVLGNHGRYLAMSAKARRHQQDFWELIGGLVNAVLVVLLALELQRVELRPEYLLAALAILPVVLLTRFMSVGLPITVLRRFRPVPPGTVQFLTWGGLRGGISVALVLLLPPGIHRDALILITAVVIVFAIAVQGLTFRQLVQHHGN